MIARGIRPAGRGLLATTIALLIVAALAFAQLRRVGVEVKTTADAFVLPAIGPPSARLADGRVSTVIDTTPAPWPAEATTIYRLSSLGIPLRIVVQERSRLVRFVVRRAAHGKLVAVFADQADAQAVGLFVRDAGG